MNIYKFKELSNGDILLEKVNIDENLYTIINQENDDILLKKISTINITDIKDIKNHDFKKSEILSCFVNNKEINRLKYKCVLEEVYHIINDGSSIIKKTKLNIKTIRKENEGYYYLELLGISVQGADSNKCISEICNQCIENEIPFKMNIKLYNNILININL